MKKSYRIKKFWKSNNIKLGKNKEKIRRQGGRKGMLSTTKLKRKRKLDMNMKNNS